MSVQYIGGINVSNVILGIIVCAQYKNSFFVCVLLVFACFVV